MATYDSGLPRRNVVKLKTLQRASRRLEVICLEDEPGRYLVASASQRGYFYEVTIDAATLSGQCSCRWAAYGGVNCKHVLAVLRAHYADQGRLSFWRSLPEARRQHRAIIVGDNLVATLRRAA